MRRRLLGTLLWLLLLPLVGAGRLLWFTLQLLTRQRLQTLLTLLGLAVAMSLPGPLATQLSEAGIWPPGQVILARASVVLGIVVLWFGLRSTGLSRLRRRLWQVGT